MAQPIVSVGVHLTPRTDIEAWEHVTDGVRGSVIRLGDVSLYVNDREGDAGIVAAWSALRDAVNAHIAAAQQRMADAASQPAWSESELAGAYGR